MTELSMISKFKTLPFLILLAMTAPVSAQTTETETTTEVESETEEATPDPLDLNMGEVEGSEGTPENGVYVLDEHGDWEIRCIKTADAPDTCQLYQLLDDGNGNPVAEINIFPVGGEGLPAAGATVITPLETLLTQQLGLSVDGGTARKYPFSWCSAVGCFSRIGFSEGDLASFRKGANAALSIVPVAAPDQTVQLKVSLSGFTAGYEATVAANSQ